MTDNKKVDDIPHCAFCGRSKNDVLALIAGPNLYICDDCIRICNEILLNAEREEDLGSFSGEVNLDNIPTPKEIYKILSSYIVGQEDAKKILSVGVYNHFKRIKIGKEEYYKKRSEIIKKNKDDAKSKNDTVTEDSENIINLKNDQTTEKVSESVDDLSKEVDAKKPANNVLKDLNSPEFMDIEIAKSNILMIGPTGSGKTLLAETLAKIFDVPFAIADATTLTEAGYVGEDVENVLLKLVQAADYNIKKAELGIIFIDEIDKIANRNSNVSITRDVSGEGVQQALLKIIEGTMANIPPKGGRKHPDEEYIKMNTKNILFIVGGAFSGLEKIIKRRLGDKVIGFNKTLEKDEFDKNENEILKFVEQEDILKFGIIPELIGRLPVISTLNKLTQDDLVRIIKEPKNSILKQYKKLFKFENVELEVTDDALFEIAELAIKKNTGARGLRGAFEKIMNETMFELPGNKDVKKVVVNGDVIKKGMKPLIVLKGENKNTQTNKTPKRQVR